MAQCSYCGRPKPHLSPCRGTRGLLADDKALVADARAALCVAACEGVADAELHGGLVLKLLSKVHRRELLEQAADG